MPLAREQRDTLARVLKWSRSNGWTHDAYPSTWRSVDGNAHVRFDALDNELIVDRQTADPLRCRVAIVPVDCPETAVNVLAALGYLPVELSPIGRGLLCDLSADDETRAVYDKLITDDRHAYMSTYCQHGLHDGCRETCKCCGAPCVCTGCLHTPPVPEPAPAEVWCLKRVHHQDHPAHRWEYDGALVECLGWPLLTAVTGDDPNDYDGPASFLDAGQAFADLVDGRVCARQAADTLSKLARAGLIVSTRYHDETCGTLDLAALLNEENS